MARYLAFLLLFLGLGLLTQGQAQVVNFKDSAFKTHLIAIGVDQNGNGQIEVSEAQSRTELTLLNSPPIQDMTGLEEFVNLHTLRLNANPVKHLPLETLTKLEVLDARDAALDSLNLDHTLLLKELQVKGNPLKELDLRALSQLESANMGNCPITSVQFGQHPFLRDLLMFFCRVDSLDLSGLPALRNLEVQGNLLYRLNLRANTKLEVVFCDRNGLVDLLLPNGFRLRSLTCRFNALKELDIRDLIFLEGVDCAYNSLEKLHMERNFGLFNLTCYGNKLTELNFQACPQLLFADCHENQLSQVEAGMNAGLLSLNISENLIDTFDVGIFPNLQDLKISDNPLEELIIPAQNNLSALAVGPNEVMETLIIPESNFLSSMDLSYCPELSRVCFWDLRKTLGIISIHDVGSPQITYASCQGKEDLLNPEGALVFPNSVSHTLFFRSQWDNTGNRVSLPTQVTFFTFGGQRVWEQELAPPPGILAEVEISHLPDGLYLVRVDYDNSIGEYPPVWVRIQIAKI